MKARSVPKLTACAILAAAVFPQLAGANDDRQEAIRPVAVDTSGLSPYLAEKVREKASQGAVPLIRYLHDTRMVYQLRVEEVMAPELRLRVVAGDKRESSGALAIAEVVVVE